MTANSAPIRHYMTTGVLTIAAGQSMSVAYQVMHEHRIRHLPVIHAGKLVGVVTDRDLHIVERRPGVGGPPSAGSTARIFRAWTQNIRE